MDHDDIIELANDPDASAPDVHLVIKAQEEGQLEPPVIHIK